MKAGGLVLGCVGLLIAAVVIFALFGVGVYNRLVGLEEDVTEKWAQVENVYQRRADLIPNLVATVRGVADFERTTLENVIEARSRVGQMTVPSNITENPAAFQQFEQSQSALSSALSRLLVVVERYPELRATQNFLELQSQLEGTENRITVERMRYNESARGYNTALRRFPANFIGRILGFEAKNYFEAQPGADQVPDVNFDFSGQPQTTPPPAVPQPVQP